MSGNVRQRELGHDRQGAWENQAVDVKKYMFMALPLGADNKGNNVRGENKNVFG